MDELNNLMGGFAVAMTGPNLLFMLVGITLGVLIGVLPGLGGAEEQESLQSELRQGQYHPQPARRVWIPKLGTNEQRPLGVPVVDRKSVV